MHGLALCLMTHKVCLIQQTQAGGHAQCTVYWSHLLPSASDIRALAMMQGTTSQSLNESKYQKLCLSGLPPCLLLSDAIFRQDAIQVHTPARNQRRATVEMWYPLWDHQQRYRQLQDSLVDKTADQKAPHLQMLECWWWWVWYSSQVWCWSHAV